jgi:hypothetical protein
MYQRIASLEARIARLEARLKRASFFKVLPEKVSNWIEKVKNTNIPEYKISVESYPTNSDPTVVFKVNYRKGSVPVYFKVFFDDEYLEMKGIEPDFTSQTKFQLSLDPNFRGLVTKASDVKKGKVIPDIIEFKFNKLINRSVDVFAHFITTYVKSIYDYSDENYYGMLVNKSIYTRDQYDESPSNMLGMFS